MKTGDLVKLCPVNYPQYAGKTGVLVGYGTHPAPATPWEVMINGKVHSFYIYACDMELANESR